VGFSKGPQPPRETPASPCAVEYSRLRDNLFVMTETGSRSLYSPAGSTDGPHERRLPDAGVYELIKQG